MYGRISSMSNNCSGSTTSSHMGHSRNSERILKINEYDVLTDRFIIQISSSLPFHHHLLLHDGSKAGEITSGTGCHLNFGDMLSSSNTNGQIGLTASAAYIHVA